MEISRIKVITSKTVIKSDTVTSLRMKARVKKMNYYHNLDKQYIVWVYTMDDFFLIGLVVLWTHEANDDYKMTDSCP